MAIPTVCAKRELVSYRYFPSNGRLYFANKYWLHDICVLSSNCKSMCLIIVDLPLYWCIDTIARDTTYAILVSVLVTDTISYQYPLHQIT